MIKEVQKVKIIVPKESKDEIILALQKEAIVMLPKHVDNESSEIKIEDEIISRADIAIKKLGGHLSKNKKFFHSTTVEYEDFINNYDKRISILEKIESNFDQLNFLTSENEELQKQIDDVYSFKDLKYSTKELTNSIFTSFHFGYLPENRWDFFNSYCNRENVSYTKFSQSENGYNILVYLAKDEIETKHNQLKRFGFVEVELPILEEPFGSYINSKKELIRKNNNEMTDIRLFLSNANEEELELKILVDQTLSQSERKQIIYTEDDKDTIFSAWVDVDKVNSLQRVVRKVTTGFQLEIDEPNELDEVPTLLENKKVFQPFESIMNTYSVPNYKEVDPTPVMSFWYWLIFGMMMGDIGYGLMMVVIFGLFLKLKKPKGEFGSLVTVFFYSGITTIFFGIIYGSFFGTSFDLFKVIGNIFNQNWTSVIMNPVNDVMTMLIFSMGIGILHLSSGLVMKIRLEFKRKDYIEGISKGLSWLLILLGIGLFAITMFANIPSIFKTLSIITIIIGVLLIVVFGGLKKKSIFGKIFGGFGGLLGVTNYLSDVLSYSRILALALSSAVIASTMNLLASLMHGNVFTFFFAIIIYIIGHVFTFVLGMLSAYVHGSRLEYLEFFGKFYEGGGYLFEPLQFNAKYINKITFKEE